MPPTDPKEPWAPPGAPPRRLPPVARILKVDAPAGVAALTFALVWTLHAGAVALGRLPWGIEALIATASEDPAPLILTTAGTVLGLGIATWRVLRIRGVFARGAEVEGEITTLNFHRGRGRIYYTFQHRGKAHTSWAPVHQSKAVRRLRVGDRVPILVDPEAPKRAYLRDLYR